MTYKQRVIAMLEAGPATTDDIALEIYGSTDAPSRAKAAGLLWQVRADGVPVHSTRRIDNGRRYGQPLKLWELRP